VRPHVVGKKEGRFDVCIAAAGTLHTILFSSLNQHDLAGIGRSTHILEIDAKEFENFLTFYTAQAAGRQSELWDITPEQDANLVLMKFGNGGSIITIVSISGHVTLQVSSLNLWFPRLAFTV
jgi:hypothetical protein